VKGSKRGERAGSIAPNADGEEGTGPPDATTQDRATRQRARILDAAERCFIERGFHAASMAQIAATAGISPGLIYRYFSAKHQIVQAIVERHMDTDGCPAMHRLNAPEDFCTEALRMYERWRQRDDPSVNAAMMLDLTAEAARDPDIARIVRDKDQVISNDLTVAVQRAARSQGVRLTASAAFTRAVLLQSLIEGLAFRVVRDPTLSAETLRPLLSRIVGALMR
jgi:AcrR family transcriptional regulator